MHNYERQQINEALTVILRLMGDKRKSVHIKLTQICLSMNTCLFQPFVDVVAYQFGKYSNVEQEKKD